MDTTAIDKQIADLRAGDAEFGQRVADLDQAMSAWLTAMKSCQDTLANACVPPSASNEKPPAVEAPPGPAKACASPVEPDAVVADATPGDEARPAPAAAEDVPIAGEPAAAVEEVAEPPTEPVFDAAEPQPASPEPPAETSAPGREQDSPTSAGAEDDEQPADDDEALLATLDERTANAIRVKRRLTGGRKSVRELLEETGAAPMAAPEPERSGKGKRKWWRRGDD